MAVACAVNSTSCLRHGGNWFTSATKIRGRGRFPRGYSSVTKHPSSTTQVRLEAEHAQLGVPPANTSPGTVRRSRLQQDLALLGLGAIESAPGCDWVAGVTEGSIWMMLSEICRLSRLEPLLQVRDWWLQARLDGVVGATLVAIG